MPGSRSVWSCLGAILAFVLCLFLALGLFLSGWPNNKPPALVAEFSQRYASGATFNVEFDAELAKQFPPGSPESALRAELLREGFHQADVRDYVATWSHFICTGNVAVTWTAEGRGRIAMLHGTYSHVCG